MSSKNKKSQLVIIFLTVFIYLVGFGIIIPLIPLLSRDFGADATQSGMLMAIFSLMQFLFSPFWGKLSDKYGRRPILLFCLLGEGCSYILFASARSLEVLFLARAFAGFFGASISTASAYISDITAEDSRSKGMALIGAAFGLGFVFGPALGGLLAYWGHQINPATHFDTSFSSLWVAGICFANFVFGLKFLKESLDPSKQNHQQHKAGRIQLLVSKFKLETVGPLMFVYFLLSIAMAGMEATLILYMADTYKWGVQQTSLGFAFIGIMMVVTQGFLVRKVIPLWGERRVLLGGVFIFAFGMSGLAWGHDLSVLGMTMALLAVGVGLSNPSTLGSISLLTPGNQQGVTMGVTQSLSSLGRILGPVLGGVLYQWHPTAPFMTSTFFGLVAGVVVLLIFSKIPVAGQKSKIEMNLNEIGFFQFDNLIQNRVPFVLISFDNDWSHFYPHSSVYQNHLNSVIQTSTPTGFMAQLTSKNLPKDFAIVVVCPRGKDSLQAIKELDLAGYTNVYCVRGGFESLVKDRS